MVKIVDLDGTWAAAIGRAFVAFGSMEWMTVVCLRDIPVDRIQRSTRSFRLSQRIDLIQELLEVHEGDVFRLLSEKLTAVKALAEKRNFIAHNPLIFEVYASLDGDISHQQVITSIHRGRRMTFPEIQAFAEEAEKLASDLTGAGLEAIRELQSQRKGVS
jgi:stage V sporulation protein SpoVS